MSETDGERALRRMETAYAIIQSIHGDLSLEKVTTTIVENLVEIAAFASAEISFSFDVGTSRLERAARAGARELGDRVGRRMPLSIRGQEVGYLHVTCDAAEHSADQMELLEWLFPTLIMSLDNAISFAEVSDYRETLERRVAERTAELAEARDDLQKTVSDLQEAQAVRNRIFANINHEIRTPLAHVLLSTSEIRGRVRVASDLKAMAAVSNIEAACERLLSMVDSMLLLAAAQEGKIKLKRRDCDLSVETRRIVAIWQPLAEQHKLKLTYAGVDRLSSYVDTAALERILANLLSNAIKYTPDGGSIEVGLEVVANTHVITVRDTGIGIDEEFKKRIFGRFEQGRAAVRQGARSTGIGLSIVKELMEAHGGSVTVDNHPFGGSIFSLTFPTVGSDERIDQPGVGSVSIHSSHNGFGLNAMRQEPSAVLTPAKALATILVAEDDVGLRTSVGELLLEAGYRVLLAADGFAALKLAEEHLPDMLVSDVGMPGMSGLELSKRFRERPGNRLAPVLLLTAYGTISDRLSGFETGAVDYVVKPFEPKELIARVQSQLKLRDMALRLNQSEKLASLGIMSAGLAHELRNPANGLLNALQPLRELLPPETLDPETATGQLLDVVKDCAEQLSRLSRQLLGFKGGGSMTVAEEDVENLVRRSITMVGSKRKDVEIRVNASYRGQLRCAGSMMLQVLVNLIDNATQAAPANGWVDITTACEGDHVLIDVSDNGTGVPPQLRERIFEPFFTTKAPGVGTGLGLSTSRQIVEQHHGTLRVVDGTTSTFRISLPRNGPSTDAVAMAASTSA